MGDITFHKSNVFTLRFFNRHVVAFFEASGLKCGCFVR